MMSSDHPCQLNLPEKDLNEPGTGKQQFNLRIMRKDEGLVRKVYFGGAIERWEVGRLKVERLGGWKVES